MISTETRLQGIHFFKELGNYIKSSDEPPELLLHSLEEKVNAVKDWAIFQEGVGLKVVTFNLNHYKTRTYLMENPNSLREEVFGLILYTITQLGSVGLERGVVGSLVECCEKDDAVTAKEIIEKNLILPSYIYPDKEFRISNVFIKQYFKTSLMGWACFHAAHKVIDLLLELNVSLNEEYLFREYSKNSMFPSILTAVFNPSLSTKQQKEVILKLSKAGANPLTFFAKGFWGITQLGISEAKPDLIHLLMKQVKDIKEAYKVFDGKKISLINEAINFSKAGEFTKHRPDEDLPIYAVIMAFHGVISLDPKEEAELPTSFENPVDKVFDRESFNYLSGARYPSLSIYKEERENYAKIRNGYLERLTSAIISNTSMPNPVSKIIAGYALPSENQQRKKIANSCYERAFGKKEVQSQSIQIKQEEAPKHEPKKEVPVKKGLLTRIYHFGLSILSLIGNQFKKVFNWIFRIR